MKLFFLLPLSIVTCVVQEMFKLFVRRISEQIVGQHLKIGEGIFLFLGRRKLFVCLYYST